jgi:hypothetical protein
MSNGKMYFREIRGEDGELIHTVENDSPITFVPIGAQIELTGEAPILFVVRQNYVGTLDEEGNLYRQTVMVHRLPGANAVIHN